jgi:transcriptional regulator with XRE-family HTH domain
MSTTLYRRFCRNVRWYLACYNWSQNDLAEQMGCTKGYVSALLGGHAQPGLHTLQKVADALEVDPSELLRETREKKSSHMG